MDVFKSFLHYANKEVPLMEITEVSIVWLVSIKT